MESFLLGIVGFAVGAAAGAFSAFLGWNKSGEEFEPRKFISGVATGIIAGIGLVLANISGLVTAQTDIEILTQLIGFVLAIIGVDQLRTSLTGAIVNREEA